MRLEQQKTHALALAHTHTHPHPHAHTHPPVQAQHALLYRSRISSVTISEKCGSMTRTTSCTATVSASEPQCVRMASSIAAGDGPLPSYVLRSLERLPNELLVPIVAALAPESPLTTRFALRSTGTWEFRDAKHQWGDWLACHRNVLAFAQTSQRMASIAKPSLYHTIVIPSAKALVRLYRQIYFRPEIRPLIRDITCLANVAGSRTFFEVYEEWWRQNGGRTHTTHAHTHAPTLACPFPHVPAA